MVRVIIFSLIMVATGLTFGCFDSSEKTAQKPSQILGEVELYTFSPDQEHLLSGAQPFQLSPHTSLKDALNSLGQRLAETYFQKTYTGKATKIHFEVVGVNEIVISSRPLRIATVNMVDPDRDAMRYFFQGSAGARTTFYMIGATFMQPHLTPPLVDGLVFLYNGEMLPELDHINVEGILIPRLVQRVAKRAIQGIKR
ncbi:MAG: hypothetical protein JRJ45_15090 [Deltaproteobacteria bacterium]|nr:hypothetical protein [Deltaproteobacteria bacterium]